MQPSGEAAAAKSLQSCLTLCDPIDSSPPGSPVSGILQVRTLEGVAISFSSAEETWKYQYDCSATIKYRQNAQDEPGEGPSYCVGATGSASQVGWYELGLQGGLEFCQVGREGKWSSTQKEEHLQSQWCGLAWLAQAGWESQLAAAQGIWVGPQETGQRVWAPQKISPGANALSPPASSGFIRFLSLWPPEGRQGKKASMLSKVLSKGLVVFS